MSRPLMSRGLLLASAVVLTLGRPAGAAPVKLTLDNAEGHPGGEVRVPISIKNGQGVGAIQFHLVYDPKVLEWQSGEVAAGVESGAPDFKLVDPGRVRVALILGEGGINGDQPLLNAQFQVTGTSGSNSQLTVEVPRAWTHKDIVEMQVETQSGELKVVEARRETGTRWILIGCAAGAVVIVAVFVLMRRRRTAAPG